MQTNITAMIVSHDSGFLDNVCTDIYHYEQRKLKRYKGNLSEFVKVRARASCTRACRQRARPAASPAHQPAHCTCLLTASLARPQGEHHCKSSRSLPHPPLTTQAKPEAQSYYQLASATLKFTFPDPPPLDGVTSRQKSILNMKKVGLKGLKSILDTKKAGSKRGASSCLWLHHSCRAAACARAHTLLPGRGL